MISAMWLMFPALLYVSLLSLSLLFLVVKKLVRPAAHASSQPEDVRAKVAPKTSAEMRETAV